MIFFSIYLIYHIPHKHHWGGIVGGFRFTWMFGALSLEGKGPEGGTKFGCSGGFKLGGCIGTLLGLLIAVAFPGFVVASTSVFLCV